MAANSEVKGAHEPKAQTVSLAWSCLGVSLLPPGRNASPSQGYPPPPALCRWYSFIHLGEERQSGVKFLVYMEATWRSRLEPTTSRSRVRGVNRLATHAALRVIRIKVLLVISMLCKTEWSWELRTWSHKINNLDILSTSSLYFQGHPTDLFLKTNFSQQSPKMPKLASEICIHTVLLFWGIFFQNSPLYFCGKGVTNYLSYNQFYVALILHSQISADGKRLDQISMTNTNNFVVRKPKL